MSEQRLKELRAKKRLAELRAKAQAKSNPTLGQRAGALVGGSIKGATLSASDHIEAGLASLIPIDRMVAVDGSEDIRFGDYKNNLAAVRRRNQKQKQAAPKTYLGGQIAGSVAGIGKLQSAGITATKYAPKTFAPQALAAAVDAGAYAAVDSGLSGRNIRNDAKQAGLSSLAMSAFMRGSAPVAGIFRKTPKAPDTHTLQIRKDAAYDDALSRGIKYSPSQMQSLAQRTSKIVPQNSIGEATHITHPVSMNAFKRLQKYQTQPATPKHIEDFRSGLSAVNRDNGADRGLTGLIRSQVDDFQRHTVPAKISRGTPEEAHTAIQHARQAHRRYEQSQELDHILNKIKNSATHSKGDKSESIRTALRPYANARPFTPMGQQFDSEHMTRIREIVQGTPTTNVTQRGAQLLSPINRQNAAISGYAYSTPAAPFIAAANAGGVGARLASNRVTQRDFNELVAAIRNGKPVRPTHGKFEAILRDPEMRAALSAATGVSFAGVE